VVDGGFRSFFCDISGNFTLGCCLLRCDRKLDVLYEPDVLPPHDTDALHILQLARDLSEASTVKYSQTLLR